MQCIKKEKFVVKCNANLSGSGSWHGPSSKNNAKKDFERQRIESAVFFDIDEVSDKKTDLPHMLPSPEEFAEYVGKVRAHKGTSGSL